MCKCPNKPENKKVEIGILNVEIGIINVEIGILNSVSMCQYPNKPLNKKQDNTIANLGHYPHLCQSISKPLANPNQSSRGHNLLRV